jgi:dolichol kinase
VGRSVGYNRAARKLLHIAGGLPALAVPFVPYWAALAAGSLLMVTALLLRPRHAWWLRVLSKPADRVRGVITGLRGYCFVILLLLVLWRPLLLITADAERYVMLGWLTLSLGDGLAGLLGPGPKTGRTVPWNRRKTWWGLLGCFAGVLLAYGVCLAVPWSGVSALRSPAEWSVGLSVALLVALLESADTPLDDNYLVGLGAPLLAWALGVLVL